MGNYHPISILSIFSKILEKLIYNRTQSFLEKHSITLPTQYGFRPAYSTSHAMTDILNSTLENINVNKNTALLLLDLKKAFDKVHHDILLNKMNHYGIRGNANNLFASFLANRKQCYIFLNHSQSNYRYIKCGVSQGSVLGPLLFTIYINDRRSSTNSAPRLCADDTCLILLDDSISNSKYKIKGEINAVNKWMIANKLTLNMSKSNVIIINSNKNGKSSKNCYNEVLPIMIVKNAKYLGVTFNESLSFDCHIKNLIKRLSRSVGILTKVKPFLNTKSLLNLYYATVFSTRISNMV